MAKVALKKKIAVAKKGDSVTKAIANGARPLPGRFGAYGGRYVPETLMAALEELESAYEKAKRDKKFQAEFARLLKDYCGRPTPLTFAGRLTKHLGGARVYLKREDLLHTG